MHLLGYSLSTADGEVRHFYQLSLSLTPHVDQLDARAVMQFDRIQGFGCVAAKLPCNHFGDSEIIIERLLSLFFWRRGKQGARAGVQGAVSDSNVAASIFSNLAVDEEVRPNVGVDC